MAVVLNDHANRMNVNRQLEKAWGNHSKAESDDQK